jgi:cytochrome c553
MIVVAGAAPGQAGTGGTGKAALCAGCHGGEGISTNPVWPNLAGQHGAYLVDALKAYRSGVRQNAMMSATAAGLSDADIQSLSDHYAAMKLKGAASGAGPTSAAAGKAKADACATCHGADGVSSNPAWPSLAGQQKDYLVGALKAYQEGARKNEIMAGMAKGLSDADIDALATYYSSTTVH